MSLERTLTGEVRVREHKRWFRSSVLVLQVKVQYKGEVMTNAGGRVEVDDYSTHIWEDARVTDLRLCDIKCK